MIGLFFSLENDLVTLIHTITICFRASSKQPVKDVRKMI